MLPPPVIESFIVVEYGFFPEPLLPRGYIPPPNDRQELRLMQNVAICRAPGCDGFYTLFCTPGWEYVTGAFNETMEYAKRTPLVEFGNDVIEWRKCGQHKPCR